MRENRPYGSEGGEDLSGLPYPYRQDDDQCVRRAKVGAYSDDHLTSSRALTRSKGDRMLETSTR